MSNLSYKSNPSYSFTLMELLIVISLIALLAVAAIVLLNPKKQLEKAWDGQRKQELSTLKKVFEDFYNDKNCYPQPDEVCYENTTSTACPICGRHQNSPHLSPYLANLPCDPQHSSKKYLYQVDNTSCPTWYRIYTKLSNTNDPVIIEVGCRYGCGVAPDFTYNYGVGSPNIGLEANNNLCSLATPLYVNPGCNICGGQDDGPPPAPYEKCKSMYPGKIYYTDPISCTITCIKD